MENLIFLSDSIWHFQFGLLICKLNFTEISWRNSVISFYSFPVSISSGKRPYPKIHKEEPSWLITLSTHKSPNKFRKFCDKHKHINTECLLLHSGSNLLYWSQGSGKPLCHFYEGKIFSSSLAFGVTNYSAFFFFFFFSSTFCIIILPSFLLRKQASKAFQWWVANWWDLSIWGLYYLLPFHKIPLGSKS